ncbi:hypothetical protein FJV81_19785 [Mesorhizobium sp. WSM4315]|nr:hypothetical protein FJV81_19785 [Mesorhizobium sp. WSM4315]
MPVCLWSKWLLPPDWDRSDSPPPPRGGGRGEAAGRGDGADVSGSPHADAARRPSPQGGG